MSERVQTVEDTSGCWCAKSQKLILNDFELEHKTVQKSQIICCAKGKGVVDNCTVTRRFKNFTRVVSTLIIRERQFVLEP